MGLVERLAELKNYKKPPTPDRQNRQNPLFVSFVTPDRGPSEIFSPALNAEGYPTELCKKCGGGTFYMATSWRCSRCYPPETIPRETLTLPGGTVEQGEEKDVDSVLRRAVVGTAIQVEQLQEALSKADLEDVRWGRITVQNLRAFVATLEPEPKRPVQSVCCIECINFRRNHYHPNLGTCTAGVQPSGAAGLWDTDRRHCTLFSSVASQPTRSEKSGLVMLGKFAK